MGSLTLWATDPLALPISRRIVRTPVTSLSVRAPENEKKYALLSGGGLLFEETLLYVKLAAVPVTNPLWRLESVSVPAALGCTCPA